MKVRDGPLGFSGLPLLASSESPLKPSAESTRLALKELVVLGAIAALCLGGIVFWANTDSGPGTSRVSSKSKSATGLLAMFVGDRACRECHPGESAAHSRSGHARTLRPAAQLDLAKTLDGLRVRDPEQPDATWSYALRDGRFRVERSRGNETDRFVIDYAFGSGHHATTFVSLTDPDPRHLAGLEHRLTYFAATRKLDITPGQKAGEAIDEATPLGSRLPSEEVVHCFRCHTTMTSEEDAKVLDTATMIPNVACERCHGPGRAHVEAARRGEENLPMPFGPGRTTSEQQMRFCGYCHRYPVPTTPRADYEVPPSQIRPDNLLIGRFQPVGLMQSACYKRSEGALSCLTCHDPHARTSKDRALYEAACLSCHQSESATAGCPISPRTGCLNCHMPARDTGQGILFTDHWIRVRKAD